MGAVPKRDPTLKKNCFASSVSTRQKLKYQNLANGKFDYNVKKRGLTLIGTIPKSGRK